MKKYIAIPSIPDDEVTGSELTHTAFLSHEGTEKRTVVRLLLQELHEQGIPEKEVFYDQYMKLGGDIDANQVSSLTNGLLASKLMIAFLTPDFVRKRWPMWELKTFLEMMRKDRRRELLPVFYRLSAKECENIAEQAMSEELKGKVGPAAESGEVRVVMGEVKEKVGIDAQGQRLSDPEVVSRIMRGVFRIVTSGNRMRENVQYEDHEVTTCIKPLCENPTCAKAIKSKLSAFFAIPPLPSYTKLDFDENSKRPEKMLKEKLLLKSSQAVAAVGAKGMGGVGKTTCLIGVANDLQVREAFPDGVLWIQLSRGTRVEHVREILVNILKHAWYHWEERSIKVALNPRTLLDDVVEMTREALQEKGCLIVLDDVWPFDGYKDAIGCLKKILNQSSRILLSTRYSKIVDGFDAAQTDVGDLDGKTASALFDDWCGEIARGEEEENVKKEILKLCSNVALWVCIAGSNVKRIAKVDGKEDGLKRVLRKLKQNFGSLQKLDHVRDDQMSNAVIQTTMDSTIDEGDKNGYRRLAVFNNKTKIPRQTLEALWGLDADSVEDRVDFYVSCSLATRKVIVKSGCRRSFYVEFHDQHLAYARYSWWVANSKFGAGRKGRSWKKEEEEILRRLHAELVDGYRELHEEANARVWWEAEELKDGYFHKNYARHLAKSERMKDLVELLMDYRWISMRCRREEITGLLEDFDIAISILGRCQTRESLEWSHGGSNESLAWSNEPSAGADTVVTHSRVCDALHLAQRALQKSQPTLWERMDEAPFQLVGRLRRHSKENALIERLIDSARRWERRPWLWPVSQCFESPMSGASQVLLADSKVSSVAFVSGKLPLVACGTWYGDVRAWDWRTGRCVWSRKCYGGLVWSLALTTDGIIIVSGSWDKTVRIWDEESGEKRVFRGHENMVNSVAVTEDGSVVVSGSYDKTVRVWDVKSGECKRVFRGHDHFVRSVAMTEDGKVVVSGSVDKTVRIWDVDNGKCKKVLRGHEGWVNSIAVTKDRNFVVSGSDDKTVRIWNMNNGKCKSLLEGHEHSVNSIAVTKDGSLVVSGSNDGTIRIWNVHSGKCKKVLLLHDTLVYSVAVTEDGGVVVSGSLDRTVRIWDVERGNSKRGLLGHNDLVGSVAVAEDGKVVVSGSNDKTVRIWDVESGKCKRALEGHVGFVKSVAATKDGSVVVSGSNDKTVRIWNAKSGECKRALEGHEGLVESVAITGDGRIAVSGSVDKTVRIWNVENGECKIVLLGHEGFVWSVGVTEDGSVVVSGSEDKTVRIWDVDSRKCKSVLVGHEHFVNSVAVTEDGSVVVSVSQDTGRIWNVDSGVCLETVRFCRYFGYSPILGSRDLLGWARSRKLLPRLGEADFGGSGSWSALPGGCRVIVESGLLKIVRGEGPGRVTSATFDSAVESALAVNLNDNRRVVVVAGGNVFILKIMNPEQLGKEIGLMDEGSDGWGEKKRCNKMEKVELGSVFQS